MKVSMTEPLITPSLSQDTECRGPVGVRRSGLLRSRVALLSLPSYAVLLESMGWVSGFSRTPQPPHGAPLSKEAQQGLLFGPGGHVST